MKRRDFLHNSAMLSAASALALLPQGPVFGRDGAALSKEAPVPLAPTQDPIPVAFVISQGAVVIDFCGPWEVFQDTTVPGRKAPAFDLYTVAESSQPVQATAGMRIVPDYTFANAPPPKVIVVPGQRGQSEAMLRWIVSASHKADLTMSVCVGANVLAAAGLLAGRAATTHHNSYSSFAARNPDIRVIRGVRFVDDGDLATAGGLSSGIDLALHVVDRYFGREAARQTAYYMEYLGDGWQNPEANRVYKELASSHVLSFCGFA